jgi:hypothetical protein
VKTDPYDWLQSKFRVGFIYLDNFTKKSAAHFTSANSDASLIMPSIQDIPVEVWLDIFEYFGIADLYAFNTIFGGALFWVVGQAARKLVKKFLVSAKPTIESHLVCPEFNFSSESNYDMIPARPPGPMPCFLMLRENLSRTFRKNEFHSTEMTIHFDFTTWVNKIIGDLIFEPCRNGSEPAQLIYSWVHFHSNEKLADGSMESLRLTYQTEGRINPVRVDDKVHGDGRTTRTLSHGMPLCQLEWRTSNMPVRDVVKLPREWIDFLKDDIQVLMRFEGIPAATHIPRSRPDFRCLPYRLTYFEVDWTFLMGFHRK